jgi:hypothetical protein
MGLTEMHLRPFDAQGFVLLLEMYINSALYSLAVANMPASNDPTGRNISTNETRRLVRLQLPLFVKVADVTRSVDRLQAVREAVEHVESRADRLLADVARRRATRSEFDPSRLRLPGSRQKARFFSDVFRRCEIALMSESGGSSDRLPEVSFPAFDAVSAALVFQVQSAIALLSGFADGDRLWWEDRVHTHMDRLETWTQTPSVRQQRADTILTAGLSCIDVSACWSFAVQECSVILQVPEDQLVLPSKTEMHGMVFGWARRAVEAELKKRR